MKFTKSLTVRLLFRSLLSGRFSDAAGFAKHGASLVFKRLRGQNRTPLSSVARPLGLANASQQKARSYLSDAKEKFSKWQLPSALALVNRSLALNHRTIEAHRLNVQILELLGDIDGAQAAALAACEVDPLHINTLSLLSKFGLAGELNAYLDNIARIVEERSWRPGEVLTGSRSLAELGRSEEALELLDRAIEHGAIISPEQEHYIRGIALIRGNRLHEASRLFELLLDAPSFSTAARRFLGECYEEMGKFDDAKRVLEEVVEAADPLKPRGFNWPLFRMRFRSGECASAFEEARARPFTYALKEEINGLYAQDVATLASSGSAVVVADFGVGDEIRFASVYRDLSEQVPNLAITCEPRLESLFQRSFPGISFIPVVRWRYETLASNVRTRDGIRSERLSHNLDWNAVQIIEAAGSFTSIFEVLRDLRPNHRSFARDGGYLVPDAKLQQKWRAAVRLQGVDGLPNIALSWRSLLRGVPSRDRHYLEAHDLRSLSKVDACFWLFQPLMLQDEIETLRSFLPNLRVLTDLDLRDDFEGQAAFLTCMDAVVAPCNTTAELAGALGVRTVFFGRTEGAKWRVNPLGVDVWHPTVKSALGTPIGDRQATADAIVSELQLTVD